LRLTEGRGSDHHPGSLTTSARWDLGQRGHVQAGVLNARADNPGDATIQANGLVPYRNRVQLP
jgi:hypothetical protein